MSQRIGLNGECRAAAVEDDVGFHTQLVQAAAAVGLHRTAQCHCVAFVIDGLLGGYREGVE